MANFQSFDIYMRVTSGSRAFVPVSFAAKELGVKANIITNHLRTKKLDGLSFEYEPYVYADSLFALLNKRHEKEEMTYSLIVQALESNVFSIAYEDIMSTIGLNPDNSHDQSKLDAILGKISEESAKRYGCMLTAIVHSKETEAPKLPFFKLAEKLSKEGELFEDYDETKKEDFVGRHSVISANYYACDQEVL